MRPCCSAVWLCPVQVRKPKEQDTCRDLWEGVSAFWGRSSVHGGWADQPGGPNGTNETSWHLLGGDSLLFYLGSPLCQRDQGSLKEAFGKLRCSLICPVLFFRFILVSTISP